MREAAPKVRLDVGSQTVAPLAPEDAGGRRISRRSAMTGADEDGAGVVCVRSRLDCLGGDDEEDEAKPWDAFVWPRALWSGGTTAYMVAVDVRW